jgi:probable HAF family extracellular repeat protein
MFARRSLFLISALVLPSLADAQAAPQHLPQYYSVAEISVPGSVDNQVVDINDQQQAVVMWSTPQSGATAVYDGNSGTFPILNLGTMPGYISTLPSAINNAGDIAGYAYNQSAESRAFVYRNGSFVDLGLIPGGTESGASAINDAGTVVGWSYQATGEQLAARFGNGGASALTTTPWSQAYGLNSFGVAVGTAPSSVDGFAHAVIFRNGTTTDLGQPNYVSVAVDINDSEYIAGYEAAIGVWVYRSFILSPWGSKTDLGALPGYSRTAAGAINNYGMVVGQVINTPTDTRGFVYGDCRIEDLTNMIDPASPLKPFVTLVGATAINNNGVIVALGKDSRDSQYTHSYILRPVGPATNICT